MKLKVIENISSEKKDLKRYVDFRHKLYKNDPFYSSCAEFTFEMLLHGTTAFAKKCECVPCFVETESGNILAEALVILAPGDDFVQLSFFEALENQNAAVKMILDFAGDFGRKRNSQRLIIGLNGHLSYGVGLSVDMKEPNTFDSTYSKTYYCDYFSDYRSYGLSAYVSDIKAAAKKIPEIRTHEGITVRCVDLKNFRAECEIFEQLCNETIGTTFLFSGTQKGHFFDLLEPMTFFLRKENILFAYCGDKPVGFLFWHPDYNEILPKGRQVSLADIALRYTFLKNKIKKVKLNSMGVLPGYRGVATYKLLTEMHKYLDGYERVETNFVWDNNQNSTILNRSILGEKARTFKVFEVDL